MYRALLALVGVLLACAPAHARERAPGAPGDKADWASADKQGFGTSATRASRVWFTLRDADMTEVYYPDLSHPSARSLEFMVDGRRVTTGTVTQRSAHLHADVEHVEAGGWSAPTSPTRSGRRC